MEIEDIPKKLELLDRFVSPLLLEMYTHEEVAEKVKEHFMEAPGKLKLSIDIDRCTEIINALIKAFNGIFDKGSINSRFGKTDQDKAFFFVLLGKTRTESLSNLITLAEYLKEKSEIYKEAKKVLKPERNEKNFDRIIELLTEVSEALINIIGDIRGKSGRWQLLWQEEWEDIFRANN